MFHAVMWLRLYHVQHVHVMDPRQVLLLFIYHFYYIYQLWVQILQLSDRTEYTGACCSMFTINTNTYKPFKLHSVLICIKSTTTINSQKENCSSLFNEYEQVSS